MLVKTYPVPSRTYGELVCVAGVTRDGEWRRLYPISYRRQQGVEQFSKFQWLRLTATRPKSDNRPESRRPDLYSIETLGKPLTTAHSWAHRRSIVDSLPISTVRELISKWKNDRTSLGVVKPAEVLDIEVTEVVSDWSTEDQGKLLQMQLFDEPHRELKKIPFEFGYVFRCEDDEQPRRALITDWELGMLYLNSGGWDGASTEAAQSVRDRYTDFFESRSYDCRLFMGTVHPYNTWVVIGVYYPPSLVQHTMM